MTFLLPPPPSGKPLQDNGTFTTAWAQWFILVQSILRDSPVSVGFAPADATYIVKTSDSTLSNEQALSSLSSGFVKVTTGTGTLTSTATIPIANGGTGVTSLGTLSKVDDTNVTLTLGGTPTGALITSTSITAGWTGQLSVARGGTGISSFGTGIATWLGTPTSANLAAALTDETGSGSAVFADTPTLVTPVLGAATGTSLNLSGLTASRAVATDGSKNLVSVTNTGSGNNVLATSPTLVTPLLGTVTSGVISACTSTSMVMVTPLLGTPTSGVLTNCTGYTDANLSVSDITTNNASTSQHGFVKKLPNDATKYYDGTGNYTVPVGTGTVTSVSVTTSVGVSGSVATATSTPAITLTVPGRLIGRQVFTASGTYTPTSGTNGIKAIAIGAGGGGSGSGTGAGGGGNGGTTVLGSLITANGGSGSANNLGGVGGVAGTGTTHLPGSSGVNGQGLNANVIDGGTGGSGLFGSGAGLGGSSSGAGTAGGTNTGAGGGGAGGTAALNAGGGGGGGGIEMYYVSSGITGTYTVTLNNGGTAGTAGTGGQAGGAGAKGILIIQEYT